MTNQEKAEDIVRRLVAWDDTRVAIGHAGCDLGGCIPCAATGNSFGALVADARMASLSSPPVAEKELREARYERALIWIRESATDGRARHMAIAALDRSHDRNCEDSCEVRSVLFQSTEATPDTEEKK